LSKQRTVFFSRDFTEKVAKISRLEVFMTIDSVEVSPLDEVSTSELRGDFIHLKDLSPNDPTVKTNEIAHRVIDSTQSPREENPMFKVAQLARQVEIRDHRKISDHTKEMQKKLQIIESLLRVKSALGALTDKSPEEMSDPLKTDVEFLKQNGIEVPVSGNKILKNKRADIGDLCSRQADTAKLEMSTLINGKISVLTTNLNAIMQAMKQIVEGYSKTIRDILARIRA
jgi:hypothetical protein